MSSSLPSEMTHHLMRLARKLRDDPAYIASVLFAYQSQEKLDDTQMARRLAFDVSQLPRLALCKRPQSQSNSFAKQIGQIATYTGADQVVLAQVIRQVEALEQLHALPTVDAGTEEQPLLSQSGLMAAARDRGESEAESTPDDELEDKDEADS